MTVTRTNSGLGRDQSQNARRQGMNGGEELMAARVDHSFNQFVNGKRERWITERR